MKCVFSSPGPPPFGSSWVKRYCTFVKEQKILHMVTFDHRSGGKMVSRDPYNQRQVLEAIQITVQVAHQIIDYSMCVSSLFKYI